MHQVRFVMIGLQIALLVQLCVCIVTHSDTNLMNRNHCDPCVCDFTLHTANCSQRNLTVVPDHLPADIQHLNLARNNLTKVRARSFEKYRNLTHLNLERNHLNLLNEVYDENAFVGLKDLKVLKLCWNCDSNENSTRQYSYPDKAFSKLTSLGELYIDGVPNVIFGTGFKNLTNLQNIIFCGYCCLTYIQEDMFMNTPYLRHLNMSGCSIHDISNNTFSPLSSIDTIDISNNTQMGLKNALASTYGLQYSSIRVMNISRVVELFTVGVVVENTSLLYLYNTNITELQNNHNWIEILEPGTLFHYPKSLKMVSVTDNRFMAGNYCLEAENMTGLKHIDVSDMSIGHHFFRFLQESPGKNTKALQGPPDLEVIIARNFILGGTIPEMQLNAPSIKSIDLSNNVITEWIGPVHYFKTLQHADFSRCFCTKIAQTFFPSFPNLTFLNISYNYIGDVLTNDKNGSLFQELASLETLDLSMNRIKLLHQNVFKCNLNLKYLNLSNNELSIWSFDITQLKSLTEFDVSQNEIKTIVHDTRIALDSFADNLSLDLTKNPFQCTCENINFLMWLPNAKVHLKQFKSYQCIRSDDISALKSKCRSFVGYVMGGLVGIVLFLTVSVMGIVYRYRWKLKYLYYVARDRYRPQRRFGEEERYYEFDAFVSFSDEDLNFVATMLNHLEGQGRRLCVHHRDFRPGEPIASNIVRAVQRSRRTLLVLSRHFLSSTWCRYEFEMAKMEAVHEGRNVVLVIKIGEIDSADIPRELMYMMRTDSYAEFPERVEEQQAFWVTLNSAM